MALWLNQLPVHFQSAVSKNNDELVGLSNIEMVYKKRKHDKESRLATVMKGREGREAFGSKKNRNVVVQRIYDSRPFIPPNFRPN